MARLWVVAGSNGAGKSTLIEYYRHKRIFLLNPDVLAQNTPGSSFISASREAIRLRDAYVSEEKDFVWETTLSGHGELAFVRAACGQGYKLYLAFVALNEPSLHISRVMA